MKTENWAIVASLLALLGVGVMVSGSYVAGRILGDALAFAMALTFAVMAIGMKARPSLDILPVNLFVCLMSAAMVWPFAMGARSPATTIGPMEPSSAASDGRRRSLLDDPKASEPARK